jgi:transposase
MRLHSNSAKDPAEKVVKDIRRATRKQYSAAEKIRIVLEGLRGEDSIAELCRRECALRLPQCLLRAPSSR